MRMGDRTPAAYANYGPSLTSLARGIKGFGIRRSCALVALHMRSECNAAADAPHRYVFRVYARDPRPTSKRRGMLRKPAAAANGGEMDVDVTASDYCSNPWRSSHESPTDSGFHGDCPDRDGGLGYRFRAPPPEK